MANTMTLISSVTVGSGGAASIDFTSIPATYTDLAVMVSGRKSTTGAGVLLMTLNGSSSSFTYRYLQGDGSTASSGSGGTIWAGLVNGSDSTSNTFSSNSIYIPNYAGSNNKSYSSDATTENNATLNYTDFFAGLWSNTAAITSISFSNSGANFVQYSTAYLYGVKNA